MQMDEDPACLDLRGLSILSHCSPLRSHAARIAVRKIPGHTIQKLQLFMKTILEATRMHFKHLECTAPKRKLCSNCHKAGASSSSTATGPPENDANISSDQSSKCHKAGTSSSSTATGPPENNANISSDQPHSQFHGNSCPCCLKQTEPPAQDCQSPSCQVLSIGSCWNLGLDSKPWADACYTLNFFDLMSHEKGDRRVLNMLGDTHCWRKSSNTKIRICRCCSCLAKSLIMIDPSRPRIN